MVVTRNIWNCIVACALVACVSADAINPCDVDPIPPAVIDFNPNTNLDGLEFTWFDAKGREFNGQDDPALIDICNPGCNVYTFRNMVQPAINDTSDPMGAPFPGGNLRILNAGNNNGDLFDIRISVPTVATDYSANLINAYNSPNDFITTQAAITEGGFMCLGFGVLESTCPTGATVDAETAQCPETEEGGESFAVPAIMTGEIFLSMRSCESHQSRVHSIHTTHISPIC